MSGRLFFTTDTVPERDRFPAFCEEVVRRYTGLDFTMRGRSGFHASLELQCAGAIGVGRMSTTPINSARTERLLRDGDDSILVTLVDRGEGCQTQRENDRKLAPGHAIICDCGYVGELNFLTAALFWNVKIPRRQLEAFVPDVSCFAGARLDRDVTARRLLFGYLGGAFDIDLSGGGRPVELYQDHIVSLVALALGATGEKRELAERRGVAMVRRAAILREIDLCLSDPGLNATTVAARLGISPRYLRLLLEETGRSFVEHLRDRRLERAAAMLGDAAHRHRRIADVAFACGFSDLSYFNRTFRRRHGVTPSDVRGAGRRIKP